MRIVLTILLLLATLVPARGDELKADLPRLEQKPTPLEALVGEDLSYDIAFLWFDRLAKGRLTFARGERPAPTGRPSKPEPSASPPGLPATGCIATSRRWR